MPSGGKNAALKLLRSHGLRVTEPRVLILEVLNAMGEHHLRAAELSAAVWDRDPTIHRASIHRNLARLEAAGVLKHVRLGSAVYWHLAGAPHQHLVCEVCGNVITVPGHILYDWSKTLEDFFGFHVDTHHLAIAGRCSRCHKRTVSRTLLPPAHLPAGIRSLRDVQPADDERDL